MKPQWDIFASFPMEGSRDAVAWKMTATAMALNASSGWNIALLFTVNKTGLLHVVHCYCGESKYALGVWDHAL